ncbi:MAG: EamA family transporter [Oscillospiraceae bacterium]|nr:EamA family transporter [Oscillospiraceae bacterium]
MAKEKNNSKSLMATIAGLAGIFIWGVSTFFTRSLTESLGIFTQAAITAFFGGVVSLIMQAIGGDLKGNVKRAPKLYWLVTIPLYMVYKISVSMAVGAAADRSQVLTSNLISQMWPLMTLVFTVVIFRNKIKKLFPIGVLISALGLLVANSGKNFDIGSIFINIGKAWLPCFFALLSAVAWGLYSNLSRKITMGLNAGCVGILMMVSGVVCEIIAITRHEVPHFTWDAMGSLLFSVIAVAGAATFFWDLAMRNGNSMLVIVVSNFLPVISSILSAWLLGVSIEVSLIVGAFMVVIGTIISKKCILEEK